MTWRDGLCWVEIKEQPGTEPDTMHTAGDDAAMQASLDASPDPTWEVRETGETGWRNAAYDRTLATLSGADFAPVRDLVASDPPLRLEVTSNGTDPIWYEVTASPLGSGQLFYAKCITEVVKAEASQRRFVQTLSNTFAHLSIGLAIFDRRGQLAIFNPALTDLTGLTPSFLASRPAVLSFFDQLRENRLMPEPKDYASWRQDIANMVDEAAGGKYQDTWTLEDGRTYGIQGRPHADGATAFMFEDISSEVTLTRNFRIEVEQYAQMLDTVEDALAVFSSSGVLTFCNAAYRRLWQHNPESAFADVTIQDAIGVWDQTTQASEGWETLVASIKSLGPTADQTLMLTPGDGSAITCKLTAIVPDATLVTFSIASQPVVATETKGAHAD